MNVFWDMSKLVKSGVDSYCRFFGCMKKPIKFLLTWDFQLLRVRFDTAYPPALNAAWASRGLGKWFGPYFAWWPFTISHYKFLASDFVGRLATTGFWPTTDTIPNTIWIWTTKCSISSHKSFKQIANWNWPMSSLVMYWLHFLLNSVTSSRIDFAFLSVGGAPDDLWSNVWSSNLMTFPWKVRTCLAKVGGMMPAFQKVCSSCARIINAVFSWPIKRKLNSFLSAELFFLISFFCAGFFPQDSVLVVMGLTALASCAERGHHWDGAVVDFFGITVFVLNAAWRCQAIWKL